MKRFFLLIVLVMVASWMIASHRSPFHRSAAGPSGRWAVERRGRDGDVRHRHVASVTRRKTQQLPAEANGEVRQDLDEARGEVHLSSTFDDGSRVSRPVRPASPPATEEAEGLPVPIVPGTRVTEAKITPPTSQKPVATVTVDFSTQSPRYTVTGRLSATRERAVADARRIMRDALANWLDPEVPRWWTPPAPMLDAMVIGQPQIKSIEKSYGEVFEATLTVNTSPERRAALVEVYTRELVERRLVSLAATLAFILICLAVVSGYIRADEATKGYYTNRLRMLAAAGVGASGVILYHMVV
jgi:hypothetical protein